MAGKRIGCNGSAPLPIATNGAPGDGDHPRQAEVGLTRSSAPSAGILLRP
jgi:hypothetical protein